jgi:hypothetical protein
MSENLSISEGQIPIGPMFNEPMRVETVRAEGDGIWTVVLVGIKSEQFRKVSFTTGDLEKISILDTRFTYHGDIRDQFGVNQWLEHKKIITSLDLAKRGWR